MISKEYYRLVFASMKVRVPILKNFELQAKPKAMRGQWHNKAHKIKQIITIDLHGLLAQPIPATVKDTSLHCIL